jgi:3-oxoacyl-[acyl-carrier protein] reductase
MQNDLVFKDRVALVTGAARGIGKEISRVLMRQGAFVYVNDLDLTRTEACCEDLSKTLGPGKCKPIVADVSQRDQVEAMINQIIKEKAKIDFLVNNAGVTSRLSLFDITDDHWDKVLNINLRGMFFCTQAAARHMKKQKFGRIVSAASYAAWHAGINRGVYAASKAGVIALTKVWSGELAPYGITLNAHAPGDILTDMTADIRGDDEKILLERIAMHRFGTAEEVANVVAFFLSPSADYLTGTVLEVTGGKFVVQNPNDAWKMSTK